MGLIISYFNQQTTMSKYLDLVYNVISSNMKNLQKDNISFIDNKYKAVSTFERGILNLFQVIDQKSNFAQYKIIKTYQIKNEDTSITSINNLLKLISTLSNDKIIKIETYRIDNNNKKGKILRLYVLEEFYESISLQQLLGFFYDDHISRKLIVNIDCLYEELINLSSNILDHIDYLHTINIRHFNMNLSNIIYCRMKHSFCVKFTDIEAGEIYRINFGNEDIKLSDMQNINNDDYNNFIIILFQLIFFIKNLSLKNAFDYTVMYDFYKTDIKVIKNELDEIFESDGRLVYFKYILKFISESDYDKVREVNNIYKEIVRKDIETTCDKELKLDILFSLLQINEKEYLEYFYKTLNEYKIKELEWLIDYLNSKQLMHCVISTYINFIQLHYENNKKIDIMEVIDRSINEYNLHEEIPRMKVNGIFPLILAYLNNCDIDYVTILSLMRKFSTFNTGTIVNIAEKINFNNSLLKFFENPENILNQEVIDNISNILPMLSLDYLKHIMRFLDHEQILQVIRKYPVVIRRKEFYKEILYLLSNIIEKKDITENEILLSLYSLFSVILYKKNVKCCFAYSTCLSQTLMRDLANSNFSEFYFYCQTCKEKNNITCMICLICVHRCHAGHKVTPLGYSISECSCSSSMNTCNAIKSLELPNYIKHANIKPISLMYPTDDEINNLCKSPKPNVYISIEGETCTIQSKSPICTISGISNDIILENHVEETIAYYEVEILMGGYYDQIAIGLTNIESFPINEFAGYISDSIGYHGDDGKCYAHGNGYSYGTKFGSKDVIGCGITKSGNVYFVHNGCLLPLLDIKIKGNIYPIISLRGKYSSVKIIHDIIQFRFKHKKCALLKNPTSHLSYSHSFTKLLSNNEDILQAIQSNCKNFKDNLEISRKFKKYSLIMHKVCKNNKKHLLKYFILLDDSSTKNSTETNKFYENEEHFSKNQNIIEKVLKKPIFEPSVINGIEQSNLESSKRDNSKMILSIQNNSQQSSFMRKNNLSRCNNGCGTKCNIF